MKMFKFAAPVLSVLLTAACSYEERPQPSGVNIINSRVQILYARRGACGWLEMDVFLPPLVLGGRTLDWCRL